jgi:hypothetical protein
LRRRSCCSPRRTGARPSRRRRKRAISRRDGYIKAFEHREFNDDSAYDEHKRALDDLAAQLRQVIGPIDIKGFAGDGQIHLDTLVASDEDFGRLDGLVYASADDKAHVLATTASLFAKWLRAHKDWWDKNPLPQDVRAALRSDDFYTQALTNGSAVITYAEIPVAKPAQATIAFTMLAARTQSEVPRVPDEMIVFVMQGGKVFVVSAQTGVAAQPIAACDKVRQQFKTRAERVRSAYAKPGSKDQALFDASTQLEDEGDRAYRQCFARRAPQERFFAALTKQAQALVDVLPKR